MNFLSYSPQLQRVFEALGITLLHSLWQGLLLMLLLWVLLHFIRYEKANFRFILAFFSLMLMLLCFAFTLYYEWDSLKPLAPVSQSFSADTIELTDIIVSTDPGLWLQVKGEVSTLFYRFAENAHLLAIAWLIGSLLFSFRLSLGLWQIHQLKKEKQALPEFWKAKALTFQQALGIRQNVEVCINNSLDSPLTLGWLKPMILFPASMLTAMPAEQIESILVHELAHIRRHDYLWNLLQSVAEVILFYHPAYWYMASILEQEREHACDMITLKITGRPHIYAQALLQVATLRTSLSTVGLSARGRGKGRSGFAERIRRIVAPQQKKKGVQPLPFLLSFCLIGFLLFAFTLKSPFEKQNPSLIQEDKSLTYDSLRTPDYVDYRYRLFDDKSLPEMLDYSSMNDENYIIGKAVSEDEPVDVREYFNTSAIFLLDGVIVQDPEQIYISDIRRYEVYHEPLPRALQHLSERPYSSVVRAFSQMPEEIRESSHIRVGGQVFSSQNDMRIPLADIIVEVQSSGEKTTTNAQGRFSFPSVRKDDTVLFYTPSYSKPTPVAVDGREHLGLYTYIPNSIKKAEKLMERLKDRVKPVENRKSMGVLQKSSVPSDSSMYDVMAGKVLIHPQTNTVTDNSSTVALLPPGVKAAKTYYSVSDPEVLFTLDGVITDPRTVDRKLVDGASFETQNLPDGYLVEIRAVSKEAAEAARKEQQKTIISGIVTDQKTGKPLAGTNILVKGTSQETIADLSGRYQIEVPQGSGELVFAYTDYETRTETVNHKKILEIAMQPEPEQEELVDKKIAKGKVLDAITHEPLSGVEIYSMENGARIDGFTTYTDRDGKYQSVVPNHFKILVHSKQGYMDTVIPIRYLTDSDLSLSEWDIIMKRLPQDSINNNLGRVLKGQVTDAETGQAVPGVNVLLSGTTIGTVTDIDGRYQIRMDKKAESLLLSAPAYTHTQILIGDADVLNVKLPSKDMKVSKSSGDLDSTLFIIDNVVRTDISSLNELGVKQDDIRVIEVKKGESAYELMTEAQKDRYKSVIIINTSKTYVEPDNTARGKVIDDKTKKPLAGVEVSSLNDDQLKTYTDENGEYALPLNAETKYLQHRLKGYMPFVIESKIAATFENPVLMPLSKVEGNTGFESKLKVFPNPGNDEIRVNFSLQEANSVEFELLDKEGKLLHEVEYHYDASGDFEVIIPSENFPHDTYLLRIKLNGESVVKRVILK